MTSDKSETGTVYLIGAGPGDPKLITLKGLQCIRQADVLVYDHLANPQLLNEARAGAEKIYVGKRGSDHTIEQTEINKLLADQAGKGRKVARLKGGDAFIFGRGGEEALYLAEQGVPFEVVPGVSSAYAVPAYAGIPVTYRGLASDVAFITGREQQIVGGPGIDWEMLAKSIGTLVFLMGVKNLPHIVEQLISQGKPTSTPVAVIRWGTLAKQQTLVGTLEDIVEKVKREDLHPPAVIVVGDVVGLRDKLAWFERKPLFDKKVMVTRAADQASTLVQMLENAGAWVVKCPTIKIQPIDDHTVIDQSIQDISSSKSFDWTIFTSANAVRFFFDRVSSLGFDSRLLGGVKIAVIGTSTAAELKNMGLSPDLIPADFRAEGLVEEFTQLRLDNLRILIPRAEEAREILPEKLRQLGAEVQVAPLYQNVPANPPSDEIKDELSRGQINYITFTSGSAVKNFVSLMAVDGDLINALGGAKIAVIGPVTAKTVAEFGLAVDIMPGKSTISALVKAIIDKSRR